MLRLHRCAILFAMIILALAAPAAAQAAAPAPLAVAQRVADHYLATVELKLAYTDLLTLYGLERLAEVSGRDDYDAFVDRALRRLIALPSAKSPRLSFENYRMGGLAGVYRCVQGRYPGDAALLPKYVRQLVDGHPRNGHGVFCHPRDPGEKIWVDCLMAVCPFLSMAAVKLQQPALHDESIAQYVGMERALFDEKLGLFHQVQNFGRPGVSIDTWGRGNGWALIGLAELIRWLPQDHPQRAAMIARLGRLAAALEPLQAPSGMWRENLVTADAYEETSATGLILYAVAMGLRHDWLPQRFRPMAERAWQGLAATVDQQGAVHGTCIGTAGNSDSPVEFWLTRPTRTDDPHSFGPVLLAAVEMELLGRVANPYARVDWDKVECLHSFSHQHGTDPQVFWDMGFGHLPLSNYYPSRPVYPLPAKFLQKHPEALGAPNAEQHSTTDAGVHFNVLGSFYTTGYGRTPRINAGSSPVECEFSNLNVFDAEKSPWLGVYRLDVEFARRAGTSKGPAVSLTIDGAREVSPKTLAPVGEGVVSGRRLGANWRGAIALKTESATMRVRLDFDPGATRITRFRLMQGTNRPWRDAFRAALDGTLKDDSGRPIEGLLFPDAGGITINHPRGKLPPLLDMLDFDPRVLGIEVWNQHTAFGGAAMLYYQRWDEILRTGRQCYGFFVKDHMVRGRGRNVLLVSTPPGATRQQREQEALRAYREGRFFGLLGAMTVDGSGKPAPPYDNSAFRFTRIAVRENVAGEPVGLEVAVAGADRSRRPNTQIRFITDAGLAQVANTDRARIEFLRDPAGAIRCRYVRVEALAYPDTHLGGQKLTAAALAAMNVHEIARIHDRLGPAEMSKIDAGQSPIPIVDMIFSQPILLRTAR